MFFHLLRGRIQHSKGLEAVRSRKPLYMLHDLLSLGNFARNGRGLGLRASGSSNGRRICRVWEAGHGSQSSAEPVVFYVRVLQQIFYYAKGSAEPSCRTPKGFGSRGPSFEDQLFFLPSRPLTENVQLLMWISFTRLGLEGEAPQAKPPKLRWYARDPAQNQSQEPCP